MGEVKQVKLKAIAEKTTNLLTKTATKRKLKYDKIIFEHLSPPKQTKVIVSI